MKELEENHSDKIENVKQQIEEIQTIYDRSIKPHLNHTLFEVNLVEKTIVKAIFDTLPPIDFEKAKKGDISLKKRVTKKEYCIYISALNIKNVIKILARDYNIIVTTI